MNGCIRCDTLLKQIYDMRRQRDDLLAASKGLIEALNDFDNIEYIEGNTMDLDKAERKLKDVIEGIAK